MYIKIIVPTSPQTSTGLGTWLVLRKPRLLLRQSLRSSSAILHATPDTSSSSSSDRLLSLYTTGGPPRPAWKQGRRRRGEKKKVKGRKKRIVSHRWRRGGTLSASCSTTTCTRRCRLFSSGPYQQLHSDTTFLSILFRSLVNFSTFSYSLDSISLKRARCVCHEWDSFIQKALWASK